MAYVFPTIKVDVAFGSDALAASPSWTAVDADVRAFTVTRGRGSLLDHFQAGKATITLNNRSRQYDPLYASGPYYGDLEDNVRIRIRATIGGTTWPVFEGFVDNWGQPYRIGKDLVCVVTATDGFKMLQRALLTGLSFSQSLSGAMLTDVLAAVDWPTGTRLSADAGSAVCRGVGSDELARVSALALLFLIDNTEQGQIFVGRDGVIESRSRDTLVTGSAHTSSQATFGDAAGEIPYQGFDMDHSDDLVRNWFDITCDAFTTEGNVESFSDATSIGLRGIQSHQLTTLDATAPAARNTGENLLTLFKDKHPYVRDIEVKLHRADANFPDGMFASMLPLDLGWRVTAKRRPLAIGSAISQEHWVHRITHTASPAKWVTRLGLGYAPAAQTYAKWGTGEWGVDKWGW